MDDYLSKPFAQEQLHELLARWLPTRRAQPETVAALAAVTPINTQFAAPAQAPSIEIDQQVIRQLRELREGLLPRIIGLFRSSSPPLLAQLEMAVAQRDADLLYKTAHNFKNSAANLGLVELAAACRDCESKARQGDLDQAEQQLHSIQTLYGLSLQGLVELERREQGE
jgi:HPt (histidine-containing phosphotransfer) domain-containing protein